MVEELANDSLSIGLFLGLGADEKAPDHSTLTFFKNRLIENAARRYFRSIMRYTCVNMGHLKTC